MRRDMKDIIIEAERGQGDFDNPRVRHKQADPENLPEQEGIRRMYKGWGPTLGDRLGPLEKFLRSKVGKKWDDVYSEICSEADPRNLRGLHLREHVWMEVDTWTERLAELDRRWPRTSRFYSDRNGFLREDNAGRRWRYNKTKDYDPDHCSVGDQRYDRINGCWFVVEYKEAEMYRQQWNWMKQTNEKFYYTGEVRVEQRQLGKKELKKLGLSNNPNFLWWEAA